MIIELLLKCAPLKDNYREKAVVWWEIEKELCLSLQDTGSNYFQVITKVCFCCHRDLNAGHVCYFAVPVTTQGIFIMKYARLFHKEFAKSLWKLHTPYLPQILYVSLLQCISLGSLYLQSETAFIMPNPRDAIILGEGQIIISK